MLEKICKYLSFGSIAVLVAYMAAMTVLEKFSGTAAAMEWGYHSAVFIALWAVAAVAGTAFYLVEGKIGKNSIANPVSGIHLAFVFILSGALVTHIFGVQGALHLRLEDGEVREFTGDDMESRKLPFAVSLADFEHSGNNGRGCRARKAVRFHEQSGRIQGLPFLPVIL